MKTHLAGGLAVALCGVAGDPAQFPDRVQDLFYAAMPVGKRADAGACQLLFELRLRTVGDHQFGPQ